MEEGPALKRPRLQPGTASSENWMRWSENLATLQTKLLTGCLCHTETFDLQRPILPKSRPELVDVDPEFLEDYALQFISTMNLLSSTALKQQATGFICRKVMDMASGIAMDEGTWEMLIEYLDSSNKFITLATSKAFVTLLMWTKLPNLPEIFDELFKSVIVSTNDPFKLSLILEVIRGVIDYKFEEDHHLDFEEQEEVPPVHQDQCPVVESRNPSDPVTIAPTSSSNEHIFPMDTSHSITYELPIPVNNCAKVEVDTEIESEVKNLCVSALEAWWGRLLTKFQGMMTNYEPENEAPIITFLTLWLSIISIKSNLYVFDIKSYFIHLGSFVSLLTPTLPAVIWKKVIDVFNEILCYGTTLSLQEELSEEACDLAHLIIRCVKSRQFLAAVPYSRTFQGFGGNCIGSVDWKWESDQNSSVAASSTNNRLVATRGRDKQLHSSPFPTGTRSAFSNRSEPLPCSSKSLSNERSPSNAKDHCTSAVSRKLQEDDLKVTTIYIGPTPEAVRLDDTYDEMSGDLPLLQQVVLLVLKSVALTVKETRGEEDSSDESGQSASEEDISDMIIIERSIREVFRLLDNYVKSLRPFHPEAPVAEWIVKLFQDQDDALIEGMLCTLDTFTTFKGRIQASDLYSALDPTLTFNAFIFTAILEDSKVILDLLIARETAVFLGYFLRFLKYVYKNWNSFVASCGGDLDRTMGLLIRVRLTVGRLVEKHIFPYNINPVLRLLERCEEMYETNGEANEL